MKDFLQIYRYTFKYKWTAITVILCNLGFIVFNLISMALFIPFLKLLFEGTNDAQVITAPHFDGSFSGMFKYVGEWYNYQMYSMTQADPKGALIFVCITVAVAFLLKNLFRYGAIWFQSHIRTAVVRDVRDALFEKAMRLPLSHYTDERRGDLMSRMTGDVGIIENAVIAVLEMIFREPFAIFITISVLMYWSASLTIFALILLPVVAIIIAIIGKSLKRTAKQEKEQLGLVVSNIDEALGGIRIIKAFNAIKQVVGKFNSENLKHQKLITKAFRKRELASPLNETIGAIVMIAIVWYGGILVLDNDSSLSGEVFMGFIIVFSQLMRPIQSVSTSMSNLNQAYASLERINAILDADEKIYEKENSQNISDVKEGVHYNNVSFKYRDEYVIKNVSFKIPAGKMIALVGESGSGKSTLADLLPRFYDVQEGAVRIDEINVKDVSMFDLRQHIGIVSQESILFNASVKENIAFGMPDAKLEDIIQAAKIANAHGFIEELENGYETNIGERGNKLSGGQKQRLSIARAILKNPSILILDEATSALDTESERLVQEALEHLMENRTSLVIAHRLSTIQKADEILVLSKGEIKERGTHEELMKLQGIYAKLSSMQGINA